ncbi:uncharacterized protein BX663DRAFT_424862 [Cokeromyces recurvatus]|uniref:uncharacterized protein n=1 Tax=Cokeromyces recurvatus TaxID=90255 RepID=UPI0022204EA2|nr:uncharacterized protein BX663DRAFT_424862 [Cokeromyces recurvatus]KAI7907831.1 hypothetical protein BX663DRAFT_424862 [Cokeromyces recurvatus]
MVRGEDSYLNATQILKVAGFEKTRRSKILEREVLTGEHEKVQGGYGKYQGTWIPFERGKQLAEKYEVLDRLMPLLNFDPSTLKDKKDNDDLKQEEGASSSGPLALPAPPSPNNNTEEFPKSQKRPFHQSKQQTSRKKLKLVGVSPEPYLLEDPFYEHHRNLLMSIFLSDDPEDTPSLVTSALLTKDLNIDLVIDEQGHTALHWAAALGRLQIVKLLIQNGANVCRVNYEGETPLMRAAMITCCYENKCFGDMVDLMAEAIPVTDKRGRTVLHHIALTASVEGFTDAAIYYVKRFVKAVPKKSILKNILNVKDTHYYESALAIALRIECQDIADVLIKHGALDPLISNIDDNDELEFEPTKYENNPKGQELLKSVEHMIQKLEDDYKEQLKKRDLEVFKLKKELHMIKYELREAHRRLELPVSMQLAESRKRIHELEDKLNAYDELMGEDTLQDAPHTDNKLEKKVKTLQHQLESSTKLVEKLQAELEAEKKRANEKEMEYRRLIASSCGLPIEKVDALVQPLTLAIESDPPDLDMMRVIGFMERLRSNNTTSSPSVATNYASPSTPNNMTTVIASTPPTVINNSTTSTNMNNTTIPANSLSTVTTNVTATSETTDAVPI